MIINTQNTDQQLKIPCLEKKIKVLSISLWLFIGIALLMSISGWASSEKTVRVSRLELVDKKGQIPAILSAEECETIFQVIGPKPKNWSPNGGPPLPSLNVRMTGNIAGL